MMEVSIKCKLKPEAPQALFKSIFHFILSVLLFFTFGREVWFEFVEKWSLNVSLRHL